MSGTTKTVKQRCFSIRRCREHGAKKVVVLGWNFPSNVSQLFKSIRNSDPHFDVKGIPKVILNQTVKDTELEKLVKDGTIRFTGLQYLKIKKVECKAKGKDEETLTVALESYVLLSPDSLPLKKDEDRQKVLDVMAKDSLALIEYWSVDPDYDGEVFRSLRQEYRENEESNGDKFKVSPVVKMDVPKKTEKRTVCVKAVDIFGYESIEIYEF
jgi:site-specific DNA-methyltransferase (adenine-specific)/adenine-specific DNA-methyltransferase